MRRKEGSKNNNS